MNFSRPDRLPGNSNKQKGGDACSAVCNPAQNGMLQDKEYPAGKRSAIDTPKINKQSQRDNIDYSKPRHDPRHDVRMMRHTQ